MAVRIEVCERLRDYIKRPVYNEKTERYELRQFPRYHAQVAGKSVWSAGDTIDDAIGNLVRCHPKKFDIQIITLKGRQAR